jgi:hypothetical protein
MVNENENCEDLKAGLYEHSCVLLGHQAGYAAGYDDWMSMIVPAAINVSNEDDLEVFKEHPFDRQEVQTLPHTLLDQELSSEALGRLIYEDLKASKWPACADIIESPTIDAEDDIFLELNAKDAAFARQAVEPFNQFSAGGWGIESVPQYGNSQGTSLTAASDLSRCTLICLSWDDTLCPTTRCHHLLDTSKVTSAEEEGVEDEGLGSHQDAVADFLRFAASLGRIVIVTKQDKSWVRKCAAKLMPHVAHVLKELDIEICGARESLTSRLFRRCRSFGDAKEHSRYFATKAVQDVVSPRSWNKGSGASKSTCQNLVLFTHSSADLAALQALIAQKAKPEYGDKQHCGCKSLLLPPCSTLRQSTEQIRLMSMVVSNLVLEGGSMHMDMKGALQLCT